VAAVEDLTYVTHVKGDFVNLSGLHEYFAIPRLTKARPAHAVDDQNGSAVRIYIGQPNDVVGVRRGG